MKKTKEISPVEDKRIPENETKPVVRILTAVPAPEKAIRYILWGLEEEGIPAEIEEIQEKPPQILAKRAADGSQLNVGIGINGTDQVAVLHHRDLPVEKPLFSLAADEFNMTQLRILGANAARLVKGDPLLFQNERVSPVDLKGLLEFQYGGLNDLTQLPQNQLVELITLVVTDLLNNMER